MIIKTGTYRKRLRHYSQYLAPIRLILFIVFVFSASAHITAQTLRSKKVLILHSYHHFFDWTDDITKGIKTVLDDSVDLHIHYMDTKRQFTPKHLELNYEILEEKQKRYNYDLIICSDNNAFNFLKKHKNEIYGNIPVVFSGINFLTKEELTGLEEYTGINEYVDFRENFDLIKKLHPQANHLVCITDITTTGKRLKSKIQTVFKEYRAEFETTEILDNLSMDMLLTKISKLPPESVIFMTLFFKDSNDNYFRQRDAMRMISEVSPAPVYCSWDFTLPHGAIGGCLTSGFEQGKHAGLKALKILQATPPQNVPVMYKSPNFYKFDYRMLEKYNIPIKRLPKESIIINRPKKFYEIDKSLTVSILSALFLLSILSAWLAVSINKKRKAEKKLILSNDALKKAKDKAEESDRLKSAFLANMSHEIRTPMNGILGFAQLLENSDLSRDDREHYLRVIEESGYRLLNILNNLIDISKIEAGMCKTEFSTFDFAAEMHSIYPIFELEAKKKQLNFTFINPDENDTYLIYTDKTKFGQILSNLLKNAVKYTNKGDIHFGYNLYPDRLDVFVKDTGIGIEDHLKELIFDRFRQAEASIHISEGGAGLGLSICKAYAEMMDAKLRLESDSNGSTFTLSLPTEKIQRTKKSSV
jgi:signal transduction histidine kinase